MQKERAGIELSAAEQDLLYKTSTCSNKNQHEPAVIKDTEVKDDFTHVDSSDVHVNKEAETILTQIGPFNTIPSTTAVMS